MHIFTSLRRKLSLKMIVLIVIAALLLMVRAGWIITYKQTHKKWHQPSRSLYTLQPQSYEQLAAQRDVRRNDYFTTEADENYIFKDLPSTIVSDSYQRTVDALVPRIQTKRIFNPAPLGFDLFFYGICELGKIIFGLGAFIGIAGSVLNKMSGSLKQQDFEILLFLGVSSLILAANCHCTSKVYMDNATDLNVLVSFGNQTAFLPAKTHTDLDVFIGDKKVTVKNKDTQEVLTSEILPVFAAKHVFNVLGRNSYKKDSAEYRKR